MTETATQDRDQTQIDTTPDGLRAYADESCQKQEAKIRAGGGPKAIDRQHAKGRLTARERVARLIDPPTKARRGLVMYTAEEDQKLHRDRALGRVWDV